MILAAPPPLPPPPPSPAKYTRSRNTRERDYSRPARIRSVYTHNPIVRFIAHSLGFAINRRPRNMRTNDDIEASDDNPRSVQLARFHRTCRVHKFLFFFSFSLSLVSMARSLVGWFAIKRGIERWEKFIENFAPLISRCRSIREE